MNDHKHLSRRNFVKNASLGMMLIGLHPEIILPKKHLKSNQSGSDLIQNIRLLTSTSLEEMKAFYVGRMGLKVGQENHKEITFVVGPSSVTFIKINQTQDPPWYHFAFNIPENQVLKAREWHLKHTPLIPTPPRAQDPKFPEDVRHFPHWNAHSLFFWDPAGNLLEYIARHDLKNAKAGSFSSKNLLNISEIAFVVDDQQDMAKSMNKKLGLGVYPKTTNFWWAMGDENGLMLAIPKRIWGENTNKPKQFGIHPTEATIWGNQNIKYAYKGFPYSITMKK